MSDGVEKAEQAAWVKIFSVDEARDALARAYSAVADDRGGVENLYLAMSQTPEVIMPADEQYRALLHNPEAPLEPWLAELVSTYVAILCDSEYAYRSHGENYHRCYGNKDESEKMIAALRDGGWRESVEDRRLYAALAYTEKLTLHPSAMTKEDIELLREAGFDDREISQLVQLVAFFAYCSRVINGLGIRL